MYGEVQKTDVCDEDAKVADLEKLMLVKGCGPIMFVSQVSSMHVHAPCLSSSNGTAA